MPHIKILTAPLIIIAGLVLLTACGGGAAAPTSDNNTGGGVVDPCVVNPFATDCTNATPLQVLTFCRDADKTTDTKADDCAPTVNRVCTPNPFDTICTDHATAQENFCGDADRTTATKDADCAPVVERVCRENVRNLILCTAQVYVQERMRLDNACLMRTGSQAVCDEEVRVATCNANPFSTTCVESEYIMERQSRCLMDVGSDTTCIGEAGLATVFCRANPFDDALACGDPVYLPFRVPYCETNADEARCPNANYGEWVASFAGKTGAEALGTTPANLSGRVDIGFLSGLTTTKPVITGLLASNYSPVTFADFNGGDARGGSAFWVGTWDGRNSPTNYHAGILTTTDVGAPLTSDLGGKWVGRFRAWNSSLFPQGSDVDFILTVNFTAKTIYAFIENVKVGTGDFALEVDYEIGGDFDPTTGVITGTAEFGRDDGVNPGGNGAPNGALEEGDRSYLGGGILTGLIGQHGATGAFHIQVVTKDKEVYVVGGFVAVPKNLIVNHADWAEGLGVPANAATAIITKTIPAQDNGRFVITFTTPPESIEGGKAAAEFDGQPISDNLLGGFYTHTAAGVNSVGLLERTNMGAPLGDTFSGGVMTKAKWNGTIFGINANNNPDFTLEIDLSDDSVEAFYQTDDISQYYHFKGNYSATGLLTGTVNYGTFSTLASEGVSPVATSARANNGIFRGIIGQFGATAVFVSGTGVVSATGQPTGGGTGDFAGGFAVTPTAGLNPNANFNDWVRDFGRSPPPTELDATNRKNEFLAGGTAGLATTGTAQSPIAAEQHITLTRKNARFNDLPLLQFGQADDGVAFFYDTVAANDYNYYAGILSGTDLGAPITGTADTTAQWEGQFRAFLDNSGIMTHNADFVLDITFAGNTGSIESYVLIDADEDAYYHVEGTYDDHGVISGSVNYGAFTGVGTATITPDDENSEGILTGLIGEQGAVGAFIGGTGTKEALVDLTSDKIAYVGGFVAAPYIELRDRPEDTVALNDWIHGFRRHTPPLTIADATISEDNLSSLLTIPSGGTLDKAGLTKAVGGAGGAPDVVILTRPGDTMDGIAYVSGFDDTITEQLGFVGLLRTTVLGAHFPVSTDSVTTAKWAGKYYNSSYGSVTSSPITFTIDFSAARTIDGTGDGETAPVFDLVFDERGIVTGTAVSAGLVLNGLSLEEDATKVFSGTARGLIGQHGLVGTFISPTGHHGGFVADNPAFDDAPTIVSYLDWVDVTTPAATRAFPLANEFVTGADTTGASSVDFINFSNAISEDTTFGGDVSPGNINDGFQIFSNADGVGDPTNFYAGILTTTNLGAPIVEVADAVWQGHLYAARLEGAGGFEQAQFVLDFDFAMKTISAEGIPAKRESGVALADGVASYGFTAVWDDRGVFEGTIARTVASVDSDGTLTGLIGAKGAVGVFISNADEPVGYAGGFVANPNARWIVRYSDWTEDTSPSSTTTNLASNQFLTTTGDDLGLDMPLTTKKLNLSTATFDDVALGGETADGIGYEAFVEGSNNIFVSGIYATTDLGAALTAETAKGTWNGSVAVGAFSGVTPSFETYDFTLEVLFDTSTVNSGVIGDAGDTDITFTGTFNPRGVITGTTASTANGAGVMQGLIGEQGAVGVFHSDAVGGYGGGFVARRTPPSE